MSVINLEQSLLIGSGSERDCYQYPDKDHLCIKIHSRAGNGRHKPQNDRDYIYYNILEKRGISWKNIARCHGKVMTSLGEGLIFDLPRDKSGKISSTLSTAIRSQKIQKNNLNKKLDELFFYLNHHYILAYDLCPDNILLRNSDNNIQDLIIIDGLGKRRMLQLAAKSKRFCRAHLRKRWKIFLDRIEEVSFKKTPTINEA